MGPLEDNIPFDARPGKRGPIRNPLSQRMNDMEVGHSFLAETMTEVELARYWQRKLRSENKKFSILKQAYLGWRVWRLE